MLSSLRGRLWASYALLILAALVVASLFLLTYLLRNPPAYREAQERLRAVQTYLTATGAGRMALEDTAEMFNVRIIHFSANGAILLDTQPEAGHLSPRAAPPILNRATRVVRDDAGRPWQFLQSHLEDGSVVMMATPRPRVSLSAAIADELAAFLIRGGLIALVIALALAFLLARWIGGPLERLIRAANASRLQEVDLSGLQPPSEVSAVVAAFNAMVARVRASQQAQRDLIADVSHELKTPLTSIRGFAQAILDGTASSQEDRLQAVAVIHSEADRMQELVQELLDLARLETGASSMAKQQVNLLVVIQQVVERLRPIAGSAGVQLHQQLPGVAMTIVGDPDRLAQVFTNLIENAIRFVGPGGMVRIEGVSRDDALEVSVIDNGPGIAPEDLPRIFDRFFQGDCSRSRAQSGGAGLGLAIAERVVLAHNGKIAVRSHPGQGTTFTVRLPLR